MISARYTEALHDKRQVREWFDAMWSDGYVLLADFLAGSFFKEIKDFSRDVRAGTTGNIKSQRGTPMMRLAHSEQLTHLFNEIHRLRCEAEQKPYVPLDMNKQRADMPYQGANRAVSVQAPFHYDGAYVNATIGVLEPPKGQGELVLFPNSRTSKRHALGGKTVSVLLRYVPVMRYVFKHARIPVRQNVLCLFFGDRSFHGVSRVKTGERIVVTINNHW